jgi:hypothetical protein
VNDWRAYRPAIWLAMLGIALALLIQPPYLGAAIVGAAIGVGLRIQIGRRRAARGLPARRSGVARGRPPRRGRRG